MVADWHGMTSPSDDIIICAISIIEPHSVYV
jgi:hypothetical protein